MFGQYDVGETPPHFGPPNEYQHNRLRQEMHIEFLKKRVDTEQNP